jgi:hypothetical protein
MNNITEVQIIPIKPKDGLIGFASLVFDGIYLGSIGIYKRLNGELLRTSMTKSLKTINQNSKDC